MEHDVYTPTAIIGEFEVSATSYIIYILPIKDIARRHLHVGDSQTFPKCKMFHCMIDLLAADYIIRDTYRDHTLDDCQLTAFLRFISSYDEDGDQIWKYILKTWNINIRTI